MAKSNGLFSYNTPRRRPQGITPVYYPPLLIRANCFALFDVRACSRPPAALTGKVEWALIVADYHRCSVAVAQYLACGRVQHAPALIENFGHLLLSLIIVTLWVNM